MVNQTEISSCAVESPTWGCELEWSDVDRRIDIPKDLGSWEGPRMAGYNMGSELDIVNTQGRWRGIATDPLCITCPVGGEIHTVPSYSIESQFFRILRLMNIFPKLGVACPNHFHIHVRVPGLSTNLDMLKNFFKYLKKNEESLIRCTCGYGEDEVKRISDSRIPDDFKQYFFVGDAKHISAELYEAIEQAESLEEAFVDLQTIKCVEWNPVTGKVGEPVNSHRTAVNMFNLTKGDTIEFRCFRASLNPVEIWSCLAFARAFVENAVAGEAGVTVSEILAQGWYQFPELNFDEELAEGWVNTRHKKGRCGPFKKSFSSEIRIVNDPIEQVGPTSDEDEGYIEIFRICENFRQGRSLEDLQNEFYARPA